MFRSIDIPIPILSPNDSVTARKLVSINNGRIISNSFIQWFPVLEMKTTEEFGTGIHIPKYQMCTIVRLSKECPSKETVSIWRMSRDDNKKKSIKSDI